MMSCVFEAHAQQTNIAALHPSVATAQNSNIPEFQKIQALQFISNLSLITPKCLKFQSAPYFCDDHILSPGVAGSRIF